jgi:VWFA-related protein
MKQKKVPIILVIYLLIFYLLGYAQEEQAYQYKRKVFLVEMQVAVFDKEGKFVEGLKPEDFIILDEGKQQEISHFDYIVNEAQKINLASQDSAVNRRHFFLLFDLSFASNKGLKNARKAGLSFIDKILPADLVAITTYSIYEGLKVLVNFSNDKKQLKDAISSLGLAKAGHIINKSYNHNSVENINPWVFDTLSVADFVNEKVGRTGILNYESIVSNFIDQLNTLAQILKTMEGKKNILYFSEGFDSKLLTPETGLNDSAFFRYKMREMLERFAGSDCAIQAIDVGGLRVVDANEPFEERQPGQTTLFYMAQETGGIFYKNMNDLDKALDDILQSSSRSYHIGYYPKELQKEGKFRKISVKVNLPDAKLVFRKGYYEDKSYNEYTPLEKKIKLAEFIIKDIIQNDIQFEKLISTFPGNEKLARIAIFLQFSGKQFLGKTEKKRIQLQLYGFLLNDNGYFEDFFITNVTIDSREAEKSLMSHGIKFFDMLLAPPGKHKVKLIVRDSETGEMGSRICHITVPDYQSKELAMTPPIFIDNDTDWLLSRGYDPNNPTGKKEGLPVSYPFIINDQEFIPAVVPELKIGQPAQFCLKVYNLMRHPQTKAPQSRMDFEIVYPDGSFSKIQKISLVNKPTQGENNCFELLFNVIVDSHPPGNYQLKATVIDTLANKKAESSTPFILKP